MAGTAGFEPTTRESKSLVLPVTLRPNILLLMEVNLVFSNHPETRKEVLHFYDYSSREYMLPILHAGDNIWQILIESVLHFTDNNGFLNLPIWTTITLCVVGVVGFAPTRHYWQQILSLSRLLSYDIPPYKRHYRSSHAYLFLPVPIGEGQLIFTRIVTYITSQLTVA